VEMVYQRGRDALQLSVEPRAQKRVDQDVTGRDGMKMFFGLDEPDFDGRFVEQGQVGLKIFAADMPELEDMHRDGAIQRRQHPREGEAVSAVISLAAIDGKRSSEIARLFEPGQTAARGPLHQVDGGDGFML